MEGMNQQDQQQEISKRYKTLPLSHIDAETLGLKICRQWTEGNQNRDGMLLERESYTANWRDLNTQRRQGPWENASDFNIPLTLIYGKATHARLWQLFSDLSNFFGVKARTEAYEAREGQVKDFMQFVLENYSNGKIGVKDVFDEWLWETVFDGSGYLKLYYQRDVHEYLEVVPVAKLEEKLVFDANNLTGQTKVDAKLSEREEVRQEIVETPHIKRCPFEDILLPIGEKDPQTSKWVSHRIFMTEEDLKGRAAEGKYDPEATKAALEVRGRKQDTQVDQLKRDRVQIDGYDPDPSSYIQDKHAVIEWYGRAYVTDDLSNEQELERDLEKMPQELVVWTHQGSGRVLGWTYLYRISPAGIRPIFKSDFISFPDRSHGVGVAEVLAPTHNAMNAIYNLRQDNGVLSSTPFGFYRASSGLKPDKIRYEPGTFLPLDDVNDVRMVNFPFLANFGYQEEDRLNGYAERTLNLSDIQLGRTPAKVGMFRTASGANVSQQESQIQLDIHFDRIARTLSRLLQALFRLTRERMPEELVYRITGEDGKPIFGKVNRNDLKGDFDFEIMVDVLGESRSEAQQKATLLMQTLINPAFTNTGVVTPSNLYHLARNFLRKNRFKDVDNYISKPQQYTGDVITPSQRIFSIVVGNFMNPPVWQTVQLGEDHDKSLQEYAAFKAGDHFGMLHTTGQIQALEKLIAETQKMMAAQQAGGNPNLAGMQTPRDGFAPLQAGGHDQGPLGAPQGEVNGPVQ